ncbi:hypothetical protein [Kribbella sp. VKM Ac-2568]|uniref:hypothetical protein n=1 Tax=Kribbella sp. VKM Ac-2568 TaxID=2512219 RepID=UPI0010458B1B
MQNARAVWQVARFYSFDPQNPKVLPQAMRFRDEVMAANVTWWTRTTGDKVSCCPRTTGTSRSRRRCRRTTRRRRPSSSATRSASATSRSA